MCDCASGRASVIFWDIYWPILLWFLNVQQAAPILSGRGTAARHKRRTRYHPVWLMQCFYCLINHTRLCCLDLYLIIIRRPRAAHGDREGAELSMASQQFSDPVLSNSDWTSFLLDGQCKYKCPATCLGLTGEVTASLGWQIQVSRTSLTLIREIGVRCEITGCGQYEICSGKWRSLLVRRVLPASFTSRELTWKTEVPWEITGSALAVLL